MKIRVAGMDPSMLHWGVAVASLDMNQGTLSDIALKLIEPDLIASKGIRKNAIDVDRCSQLYQSLQETLQGCSVVFAEVPVGSQSASAMKSYAMCVALLGVLCAQGIHLIQVDPLENKEVFTGSKEASKKDMINRAVLLYPEANWPRLKNRVLNKAEHLADAIATIHAGVRKDEFAPYLHST